MTAGKSDVESTPSLDGQALPASAGSALFRSAVSGLWYETPQAAGTVSAVICKHCRDGVEAKETDRGLDLVHRVADFFEDHDCMPNDKVEL